jgi:quercetin dioxygenase-like cupin family protein
MCTDAVAKGANLLSRDGYRIAHVADLAWEDRKGVDGWPSRAGMYYDDKPNNLCMRLIHYTHGLTEPRHTHAGSHAAVILEGEAYIDNATLRPLDTILGPSNEPHGPLQYPSGARIFSAFQGSYYHTEVAQGSGVSHYRLIFADRVPWQPTAINGARVKTLIDHGLGRLLLELYRFDAGAVWRDPAILAGLVVDGDATIGDETLGIWDFMYLPLGESRSAVSFPRDASILAVTMR